MSGPQDLGHFTRVLPLPPNPSKVPKKAFAPPQPAPGPETEDAQEYDVRKSVWSTHLRGRTGAKNSMRKFSLQENLPPPLRNELVVERGASIQVRPSLEALKREAADLEMQIRQLQVSSFFLFLPYTLYPHHTVDKEENPNIFKILKKNVLFSHSIPFHFISFFSICFIKLCLVILKF